MLENKKKNQKKGEKWYFMVDIYYGEAFESEIWDAVT